MRKITGFEPKEQIPAKVLQLYQGVMELILQGVDVRTLKVSDITQKAGIGKGTAYDYFDTREEIIVSAILHVMVCIQEEVGPNWPGVPVFLTGWSICWRYWRRKWRSGSVFCILSIC